MNNLTVNTIQMAEPGQTFEVLGEQRLFHYSTHYTLVAFTKTLFLSLADGPPVQRQPPEPPAWAGGLEPVLQASARTAQGTWGKRNKEWDLLSVQSPIPYPRPPSPLLVFFTQVQNSGGWVGVGVVGCLGPKGLRGGIKRKRLLPEERVNMHIIVKCTTTQPLPKIVMHPAYPQPFNKQHPTSQTSPSEHCLKSVRLCMIAVQYEYANAWAGYFGWNKLWGKKVSWKGSLQRLNQMRWCS